MMKINHFEDTDTLHVAFTGNAVVKTREMSENVYIDLDIDSGCWEDNGRYRSGPN